MAGQTVLETRATEVLRDLACGESVRLRLSGACMEPRLADGDAVEVSAARHYWPGDVLACAPAGHPIAVHRLLGWRPERWTRPWRPWRVWTMGDRVTLPDTPLARDFVIGRVHLQISWTERRTAVSRYLALLAKGALTRFGLGPRRRTRPADA